MWDGWSRTAAGHPGAQGACPDTGSLGFLWGGFYSETAWWGIQRSVRVEVKRQAIFCGRTKAWLTAFESACVFYRKVLTTGTEYRGLIYYGSVSPC